MNDYPPPSSPRQSWGCLEWIVAIVCLILLWAVITPWFRMTSHMAEQTKVSNNCRQIIMALKVWAADENRMFPDAKLPPTATANEVFRVLIRDDIIQDEQIFGAIFSPFKPDGAIGSAPSFSQALEPGENHWMMMAGFSTDSPASDAPFIFENTLTPAWPLIWRTDKQKEAVRGRTWKGDKIVIGRLDNSVNVEKLVKENGVLTLPTQFRKTVEQYTKVPLRVLNLEERK